MFTGTGHTFQNNSTNYSENSNICFYPYFKHVTRFISLFRCIKLLTTVVCINLLFLLTKVIFVFFILEHVM